MVFMKLLCIPNSSTHCSSTSSIETSAYKTERASVLSHVPVGLVPYALDHHVERRLRRVQYDATRLRKVGVKLPRDAPTQQLAFCAALQIQYATPLIPGQAQLLQ